MTYRIFYSEDGFIDVEDRTENTETDLTFTGRYGTDYGESIAQNFLYLLENFANTTPPAKPVEGQIWFDTSLNTPVIKVYDGQVWRESSGIQRAETQGQLSTPKIGDLWVNTETNQVFIYSGTQWILVGPSTANDGNSGFEVKQLEGANNSFYTVLMMYIGNTPAVVISLSEFTPRTRLLGFSTLKKGVNLSNRVFTNSGLKYWGLSEKAESLVVDGTQVAARNFLRGDRVSTTDFQFNVRANDGLTVGDVTRATMGINGSDCVFRTNAAESQFQFRFSQTSPILSITSEGNVGVNTTNPETNLDVVGDASISDMLSVSTMEPNIGSTGSRIGSPTRPYGVVHSDEFVGDLIGNAESAHSLSTPRSFVLVGSMTSDSVEFDGTGSVALTVTPTVDLISQRTLQPSSNDSDEILIRRGTQLSRVTRRSLIRDALPIGSMTAFLGTNVPEGWLLCDGAVYNIDDYVELYNVLGVEYEVSTQQFSVPNFVNKAPMGEPAENEVGLSTGTYTGLADEFFSGVKYIIYTGVWQ